MALDELTRSRLEHHWARRQHYLAMVPPERKAADQCLDQMDEVLDSRPLDEGGDETSIPTTSWEQVDLTKPSPS